DELDCIVVLSFPQWLVAEYRLTPGKRLLTVNLYGRGELAADLEHGPSSYRRWGHFIPIIAEFVSDGAARIEIRKAEIPETEWICTQALAEAYLARHGRRARDGHPMRSGIPARRA